MSCILPRYLGKKKSSTTLSLFCSFFIYEYSIHPKDFVKKMRMQTMILMKQIYQQGTHHKRICDINYIIGLNAFFDCVLLGIYHTLMWNRILQHGGRGLLHVLLWCLLSSTLCRRMGKTTRVFQPFEISDLEAMISVMAKITTKGTREYSFNIISPFAFIMISPLGVLVPLVLVAPSWLVLWGLIPSLT
jgi:hypothetical protein